MASMAFLEHHLTFEHAAQFLRAGDLDQAESICRNLLKRNGRDVDALQLRGAIAMKRRDHAEALKYYKKCLALRPREPQFLFLVGKVEATSGRFAEALARFDRALALKHDFAAAAEWKATVLEWSGDYAGARAVLEPYVASGRENANMAEVQAKVDMHDKRPADAVAILNRHLAGNLDAEMRHRLGHLAGNAFEELGKFDEAFAAHTGANKAVALPFDPAEHRRFVDRLIETFSRDLLARVQAARRSRLPVFITGMPRSGTTLVEQIIDAHPQAHGAGEIRDVEEMAAGLQLEIGSLDPYPQCAADLETADLDRLAGRHLERLQRLAPRAARIANKSLSNYLHLGLIAMLFPDAAIMHCRRDPLDTCLSCYFSNILPQAYPHVKDLRHVGFAYRQYERVMDHWRTVVDRPILEVVYEDLVADVEAGARRIIDHCGLPWDDRCVDFHRTGRVVMTLSYDQVRRPMYSSSIGRYRNYERHLVPLVEALATKEASRGDEA